jgi:hypothetical protein
MADTGRDSSDDSLYAEALPDDCDHRLRVLQDYWRRHHPPEARLPGRQHIDPVDFPRLLPWIWLVDVQRSPLRFRHRLVGTEQVRIMERDHTGRWLDEVFPLFLGSPSYRQFIATAERGEIAYRRGKPQFHLSKEYLAVERLLLPLAKDGKTVDMLLAITVYHHAA